MPKISKKTTSEVNLHGRAVIGVQSALDDRRQDLSHEHITERQPTVAD